MTFLRSLFGAASLLLALVISMTMVSHRMTAQQYSYLPSPGTDDERFLSLAGGSIQTLGDNQLCFKLASPAGAASIEIGIFDGNTYATFDQGSVPLIFTLYADPEGDCSGTVQLAEWHGDAMPDNAWFNATVPNAAAARCLCGDGDYFYALKVRSFDPLAFHWSSFKLRTSGTLSALRETNISFSAPLANLLDAAVVYPAYPTLTPTTYDGTWHFKMDVTASVNALVIGDGDFDHGSFDCSENDTDDDDTPNAVPSWATASAMPEGVPSSNIACQDAAGSPTGGRTTADPPDNSRNAAFVRGISPTYEVVAPDGVHYANGNPSGNLEWEQFRLSTEPFNRSTMDYHAGALPVGIYDVVIDGLDLGNLNAFRFPYDIAGVDEGGNAVTPIPTDYSDGSITGIVYAESGANCTQGLLEPGLPLATVHLAADYNGDGVTDESWWTMTDVLGHFSFSGLHRGACTVTVDPATLAPGCTAVCDSDGAATTHMVRTTLTMCARSYYAVFAYRLAGHLF